MGISFEICRQRSEGFFTSSLASVLQTQILNPNTEIFCPQQQESFQKTSWPTWSLASWKDGSMAKFFRELSGTFHECSNVRCSSVIIANVWRKSCLKKWLDIADKQIMFCQVSCLFSYEPAECKVWSLSWEISALQIQTTCPNLIRSKHIKYVFIVSQVVSQWHLILWLFPSINFITFFSWKRLTTFRLLHRVSFQY
jgi:hypothetical protein